MPRSKPSEGFPIAPPIEPMLAKLASELPAGESWLFEPKWDGFRAIVFRDNDRIYIQSRDLRPLNRYFPELEAELRRSLPARCVVDGEIVVATPHGLDFDALQLRLHPAESRVKKLAVETPASFVAFDLLATDQDLRSVPQRDRRRMLEKAFKRTSTRIHLTPCSRDRVVAQDWFDRFEGAGLDGVIAKHEDAVYEPGKRVMIKVKHARTADCVAAGFRWHKNGPGTLVGSILLGLYDDAGALHHVGVTSAFPMAQRRKLAEEFAPLSRNAMASHPWRDWAGTEKDAVRMPGGLSRWSAGKDLSWEPLRIERVCEVKYDHLQEAPGPARGMKAARFRHAAVFLRWRFDKRPEDCRYDQLEVTPPAELSEIFGKAS